jgi:hypothetical protein
MSCDGTPTLVSTHEQIYGYPHNPPDKCVVHKNVLLLPVIQIEQWRTSNGTTETERIQTNRLACPVCKLLYMNG